MYVFEDPWTLNGVSLGSNYYCYSTVVGQLLLSVFLDLQNNTKKQMRKFSSRRLCGNIQPFDVAKLRISSKKTAKKLKFGRSLLLVQQKWTLKLRNIQHKIFAEKGPATISWITVRMGDRDHPEVKEITTKKTSKSTLTPIHNYFRNLEYAHRKVFWIHIPSFKSFV